MKAVIQRGRIRIKPVPKEKGKLVVVLKKALNEHSLPIVHTNINIGQKFYDLPCQLDNIVSLYIKLFDDIK